MYNVGYIREPTSKMLSNKYVLKELQCIFNHSN